MKKFLLALCLLCLSGFAYADAAFEAQHPRDAQGRFVTKDKDKAEVAEPKKKAVWVESDHPRDAQGRFVAKEVAALDEKSAESNGTEVVGLVVDTTRPVEFDTANSRGSANNSMKKGLSVTEDGYVSIGPLDITMPFKTARVVYMFDFKAKQNLVGGETPFITAWNKLEMTVGVVTSLEGQGMPFLGGNMLLRNVLDKVVALPEDFSLGAFGGYNFRENQPSYGLKASLKIWMI